MTTPRSSDQAEGEVMVGFVAWSPKYGVMTESFTLAGGQQVEAPGTYCLRKACDALGYQSRSQHKLNQDGWTIREVEVRFKEGKE